jgi:hypothetical protein
MCREWFGDYSSLLAALAYITCTTPNYSQRQEMANVLLVNTLLNAVVDAKNGDVGLEVCCKFLRGGFGLPPYIVW